jgi:lysophospholipase L1-like esterase
VRRFLVVLLLLVPLRASAEVILLAGDSIPYGLAPYLQAIRPHDVVVNAGMAGDVSSNLERFIARFDEAHPDAVILEYGTNDTFVPMTPHRTFLNLRLMARYARSRGATVYVLTPPPSTCKVAECEPGGDTFGIPQARNAHVRALSRILVTTRLPPRMTVIDTRDRWHEAVRGWWQNSDIYGLHPNELGYPLLAGWVSDAVK